MRDGSATRMRIARRGRTAASLGIALGLAGCVSQGLIAGRLVSPAEPQAPATPVTLSYVTEPMGSAGTLGATLPDGETYTGRFVQITSTSTADTLGWGWGGFGAYWGDWGVWGPGPWYGPADWTTFVRNYSGSVVATLFGDRGHTMRCRFQLAHPEQGITGGGVGECQTSDGSRIDAIF